MQNQAAEHGQDPQPAIQVDRYAAGEARLAGGVLVPVSRSYRKALRTRVN